MGISLGHRKKVNWHAFGVLASLMLALVLRAVIPIGYMPHTGALRDGRIQITFCTTAGNGAAVPMVLAGLFAEDDEHSENALSGTDCPYGVLSLLAIGLPSAALPLPPHAGASTPAAHAFDNAALPPSPARGPPIGSRAPPFLLS
ncbi:MAG TPA: DUF2946 family protein [Candidimonas sp.]|nr:DUF2946 family protein [Candidimonas sp.]